MKHPNTILSSPNQNIVYSGCIVLIGHFHPDETRNPVVMFSQCSNRRDGYLCGKRVIINKYVCRKRMNP